VRVTERERRESVCDRESERDTQREKQRRKERKKERREKREKKRERRIHHNTTYLSCYSCPFDHVPQRLSSRTPTHVKGHWPVQTIKRVFRGGIPAGSYIPCIHYKMMAYRHLKRRRKRTASLA